MSRTGSTAHGNTIWQSPGPRLDPDPDPTHATVPADTPRANAPGRELPTGVPRPEGGHRQPGAPRRREMAARGQWQATWEASRSRHPCQMAKPER